MKWPNMVPSRPGQVKTLQPDQHSVDISRYQSISVDIVKIPADISAKVQAIAYQLAHATRATGRGCSWELKCSAPGMRLVLAIISALLARRDIVDELRLVRLTAGFTRQLLPVPNVGSKRAFGKALQIVVLALGVVASSTLRRAKSSAIATAVVMGRRLRDLRVRWTSRLAFQVVVLALVVITTATLRGTKGSVAAVTAPCMLPGGTEGTEGTDCALCSSHIRRVRRLGSTQNWRCCPDWCQTEHKRNNGSGLGCHGKADWQHQGSWLSGGT